MSKGDPQGADKIIGSTCIHEATGFLAERILRWSQTLRETSRRMRKLEKEGDLPEWASHDNVEAAAMVAVMRALTALLGVAREDHPELFGIAQEIISDFEIDRDTCNAVAEFLLANDSMKSCLVSNTRKALARYWEDN